MSAAAAAPALFVPRLARRRLAGTIFAGVCLTLCVLAIGVLFVLLGQVFATGWEFLSLNFLTRPPSTLDVRKAGIMPALWGTVWLLVLTTLISVPVGVSAAVYLNEYARNTRLTRFILLNISNLAGVPSIVYGILGLAVFVGALQLGESVLAGALTLSLLSLPVIIIASREALIAVPDSIRQAAFALGATRWQTVRHHVLPAALPGILTGVILSVSRAVGETAPLIVVGAVAYIRFAPGGEFPGDYGGTLAGLFEFLRAGLGDKYTAMPMTVYGWTTASDPEFHRLAAAGMIVLLGVLLSMNAIAIGIRAWRQKHRIS